MVRRALGGACRRVVGLVAALVGMASIIAGCAATEFDDPVAVLADRGRDPSVRLAAMQQLGAVEHAEHPGDYARTLGDIAWSDRQPVALRLAMMDCLIQHDPHAFRSVARHRLADVGDWQVLTPLVHRIASERWRDLTPALVHALSRPSQWRS